MDQSVYLQKILDKFSEFLGPKEKTRKHPLPDTAVNKLAQQDRDLSSDDQLYLENFPYRSLIGAVLYLSMNTRADISYAVGVLARYANKPSIAACKMVVHLMQYLRGTVDKGIIFSGNEFDMHIFTDSDWAGDLLTRRSTTGYVVFAAQVAQSHGNQSCQLRCLLRVCRRSTKQRMLACKKSCGFGGCWPNLD